MAVQAVREKQGAGSPKNTTFSFFIIRPDVGNIFNIHQSISSSLDIWHRSQFYQSTNVTVQAGQQSEQKEQETWIP